MHRPNLRALIASLLVVLVTASCAQLTEQLEDLPTLSDADLRFRLAQSSKIFDADGQLITTLHKTENRTIISLKRMPKYVREAVIAIEDERFYQHKGVDVRAIARALLANVASGEIREGGSTITQQYVKNVIIAPGEIAEKTFERKIIEAALSRQVEKELSKNEILERYLNTVYFGEGAYGVQAAANTYFGKSAADLSLPEAATLAGIIRIPEEYDPYKNPKAARQRRDLVLRQMAKNGYIEEAKADKAMRKKIKLDEVTVADEYPAPYFIDYVHRLVTYDPRFKAVGDTVAERTKRLFQGGLKIYTTVDLDTQAAAEQAVNEVLPNASDPYASMVAIEPDTGHVKALVGGRDWFAPRKEDPYAKLNLAILAEPGLGRVGSGKDVQNVAPGTGRQAGSAFKPFALAAAIEHGIPLSKTYKAPSSMTFPGQNAGGDWLVQNYEGSSFGSEISVLEATVNSVNVVYAQMILESGPQAVVDIAEEMGINTELLAVPSAALGTNPVNPLGMSSAYATFATNGEYHPPVAVTRIVDTSKSKAEVIYEDRSKPSQAIDSATAYLTTTALTDVIERGTGVRAIIGRPAAGKTGTAQEYRDAWFGGYTPDLAAAVWIGYPAGEISMRTSCSGVTYACQVTRSLTSSGVTGGSFPAEIWQSFMSRALAGVPASSFTIPDIGLINVTIDTRTGCLAGGSTPEEFQASATFPKDSAPKKACAAPKEGEKVPDVVGFPADEAIALLEREGFEVREEEEPTSKYPPGIVVATDPGAGIRSTEGVPVVVYVSVPESEEEERDRDNGNGNGNGKGRGNGRGGDDRDDFSSVPNVLGMTEGQASARIREEGFSPHIIYQKESDKKRAKENRGRVWKQSPAAGTRMEQGSVVYIWVNP
ncbi:MAG TPA: transglycosylase domain-containing protein [Actinomycetota bacterium]|nr:transglycosylase domain-containing protein [Actinomycetota bacterium]